MMKKQKGRGRIRCCVCGYANKPPSEYETDDSDALHKVKKEKSLSGSAETLSAYMFYVAENRKAVKEANPGMAFGALGKLAKTV